MKKWMFAAGAAGALGALAVLYSYRRRFPRPRSVGEEDYRVHVRPLPIQAGEHRLYGELLRPVGKQGRLPTVICCHGFGSSYKECEKTAGIFLARSGYQVYCFDFYGGNTHSKSGGSMLEMSIFTEREELSAVIDTVCRLSEVDPAHVYLLGQSQGGCVAGITAPQHEQQLRAMILYYPAFCLPDDARRRFRSVADIPPVSRMFDLDVGKVYHERLLDYDVFAEISRFEKPVLILHGDADELVDLSYGKRAAEEYPNATLYTYPGEVHGFTGRGRLRAARDSYEFMQANR